MPHIRAANSPRPKVGDLLLNCTRGRGLQVKVTETFYDHPRVPDHIQVYNSISQKHDTVMLEEDQQ